MLTIQSFTFNPYQENTYIVSDASGACVIIDPGCYSQRERDQLHAYIGTHKLRVEKLLNTHGHIDHMLGNRMVKARYQVPFVTHAGVVAELEAVPAYAAMMGLSAEPSPAPDQLVDDGDTITFGDSQFEVIFTPGHSAGHISFLHRASDSLFSGDVLFYDSIGRTDLPGGSMPVLMSTIFQKLLPLGDAVKVYCGHGPATTIGRERRHNPFLLHYAQHGMS